MILHKKDIGVSIQIFLDHTKLSQSALISLSQRYENCIENQSNIIEGVPLSRSCKRVPKRFILSTNMFLLQFSFQATIGRNYTGGIALDDVQLSNGLCEDESEPQNNQQGINVTCY